MNKQTDKRRIVFSPRTRVRLDDWEFRLLEKYLKNDPAARATILKNTGIRPATINSIVERGNLELSTARRLKPFLKVLKENWQ